jgi:hypothetical protein
MASNDSKFEKVQTDFQALSVVASSLNSASDELSKVIAVLDEALKKLNLGLTVWVVFESHSVEPWQFDDEYIGYCKVNGKWGIALQRAWGDNRENDFDREGPWLFNEAPREMRLKSVDAIPKLIEALSSAASEMTKKVQEKTRGVRELTGVIEQIASADKKALAPPVPPNRSPGLPPPPTPTVTGWPTGGQMQTLSELVKSGPRDKSKEGGK